jgi:hypothetical protein
MTIAGLKSAPFREDFFQQRQPHISSNRIRKPLGMVGDRQGPHPGSGSVSCLSRFLGMKKVGCFPDLFSVTNLYTKIFRNH